MYLVIGTEFCSRCKGTKLRLDSLGIEYEYKLMSELSQEDQDKYTKMAEDCKMKGFPLIVKDNKLWTLQEVENQCI
jgi:glutaredoxin